jgi:hypothetical protein
MQDKEVTKRKITIIAYDETGIILDKKECEVDHDLLDLEVIDGELNYVCTVFCNLNLRGEMIK